MDRSLYSISLVPPVSSLSIGREGTATSGTSPPSFRYSLGSPIHVTWTAPARHSPKDWIGLYRVIDVDDRDVTKVASRGHWMPVCPAEYDDGRSSSIISIKGDGHNAHGEVYFAGDTLVWKCGVYEARYHHDGYTPLAICANWGRKHNVMAISRKFEIIMENPQVFTNEEIQHYLWPFIRNCFPATLGPRDIDDPFHLGKEKQKEKISKRIVYGIREMFPLHSLSLPPSIDEFLRLTSCRFGIEFAWQVVEIDGCVRRLVWRIAEAKRALRLFEGPSSTNPTPP